MKRLLAFSICVSILILSACSKEQQATNKIDGVWEYVSIINYNSGVATEQEIIEGSTMTFEKCNLNKSDWCFGSISIDGLDFPFDYKMIEGGKKMLYKQTTVTQPGQEPETSSYYISELTNKKLRFEVIKDGTVTKTELKKK